MNLHREDAPERLCNPAQIIARSVGAEESKLIIIKSAYTTENDLIWDDFLLSFTRKSVIWCACLSFAHWVKTSRPKGSPDLTTVFCVWLAQLGKFTETKPKWTCFFHLHGAVPVLNCTVLKICHMRCHVWPFWSVILSISTRARAAVKYLGTRVIFKLCFFSCDVFQRKRQTLTMFPAKFPVACPWCAFPSSWSEVTQKCDDVNSPRPAEVTHRSSAAALAGHHWTIKNNEHRTGLMRK